MAKKLINRGELVAYRKMLAENPDALTKKTKRRIEKRCRALENGKCELRGLTE